MSYRRFNAAQRSQSDLQCQFIVLASSVARDCKCWHHNPRTTRISVRGVLVSCNASTPELEEDSRDVKLKQLYRVLSAACLTLQHSLEVFWWHFWPIIEKAYSVTKKPPEGQLEPCLVTCKVLCHNEIAQRNTTSELHGLLSAKFATQLHGCQGGRSILEDAETTMYWCLWNRMNAIYTRLLLMENLLKQNRCSIPPAP